MLGQKSPQNWKIPTFYHSKIQVLPIQFLKDCTAFGKWWIFEKISQHISISIIQPKSIANKVWSCPLIFKANLPPDQG